MQKHSWIPAATVAVLSLVAFAYTALSLKHDDRLAVEDPIMGWQSYCATPATGVSTEGSVSFRTLGIDKLPAVAPDFRSGYGYISERGIIARDLSGGKEYVSSGSSWREAARGDCPPFEHKGFVFSYDADSVYACPGDGGACRAIPIKADSWPYVFAASEASVLAVTNYGDALIFRDGRWCRADRSDDTYRCTTHSPEPIVEPRGVQFYSSVRYRGRTIVGEWPTGLLYEFDGAELKPATFIPQPPFAGQPVGYEAQSMAVYCGNLYVGYWPHGEIWRLSTNGWELAARLFSHPDEPEPFIPYAGSEPEGMPHAFFGQRVTALVPADGALYAFTSNLRAWPSGFEPEFLTADQTEEYGAVHVIRSMGSC